VQRVVMSVIVGVQTPEKAPRPVEPIGDDSLDNYLPLGDGGLDAGDAGDATPLNIRNIWADGHNNSLMDESLGGDFGDGFGDAFQGGGDGFGGGSAGAFADFGGDDDGGIIDGGDDGFGGFGDDGFRGDNDGFGGGISVGDLGSIGGGGFPDAFEAIPAGAASPTQTHAHAFDDRYLDLSDFDFLTPQKAEQKASGYTPLIIDAPSEGSASGDSSAAGASPDAEEDLSKAVGFRVRLRGRRYTDDPAGRGVLWNYECKSLAATKHMLRRHGCDTLQVDSLDLVARPGAKDESFVSAVPSAPLSSPLLLTYHPERETMPMSEHHEYEPSPNAWLVHRYPGT